MAGCPSRYRRSALSVDPPGLQGCVRGVQWPLQELQRRVRGLQRRARGLRGAGGPRRTGVVAVGHERRADEETRVWAARHAAFIPAWHERGEGGGSAEGPRTQASRGPVASIGGPRSSGRAWARGAHRRPAASPRRARRHPWRSVGARPRGPLAGRGAPAPARRPAAW